MYLFPSFTLPPKAVAKAQELKLQPDVYYSVQLLEATGLCVVPGSGFGRQEKQKSEKDKGCWNVVDF